MRTILTFACLLLAALPASAANFPYIRLNGKTNVVSDNGTNLTYNGSAIGGGSSLWTTNAIGPFGISGWIGNNWTNTVRTTYDGSTFVGAEAFALQSMDYHSNDPLPIGLGTFFAMQRQSTTGATNAGGILLNAENGSLDTGADGIGSVVTWLINYSGTNSILSNHPEFVIIGNHGNGSALLPGEPIFGVNNDFSANMIISVVGENAFPDGSGRVGINTNSPSVPFEVLGDTKINGVITASSGVFPNALTGTLENNFYRGNSDGVSIGTSAGALVGTNNDVNVGFFAGYQATNSGFATRVGRHAGYDAYSAPSAVFVGHAAGQYAHGADSTVAVGYLAGRYNETSDHATFVGPNAGQFATNAQGAVMVGYGAGENSSTGDHSVLLGANAGQNSTVNPNSVMIGRWAGLNAANASQSVYIGAFAAENFSRHHSLVIDSQTGYAETGTNALIYGEFDSRNLVFNGTTTVKSNFVATGTLSAGSTNAWKLGGVTNGAPNVEVNGRSYQLQSLNQGTLTHAGTVTLDFDGTTTANTISLTGAVTFAFSNVATNRNYHLLIKGCSTNSVITWPAGIHGQASTLSTANKWTLCSLEAWGTGDTNVVVGSMDDP